MKDKTFAQLKHDWELAGEEDCYRMFIKGDLSGGMNEEGNFKESGSHDVVELQKALAKVGLTLEGKDMLEIGCGAGRMAEYFMKLVKSYIGMDISSSMIKRCKERLGNIDCRVEKDLSNFKKRSFDIVFSYATLQHAPKDIVRKYLKQMKGLIRKDGHIMIQLPIGNRKEISPAYDFSPENRDKLKDKTSHNALSFREWEKEEFSNLIEGLNLLITVRMADGSDLFILTL